MDSKISKKKKVALWKKILLVPMSIVLLLVLWVTYRIFIAPHFFELFYVKKGGMAPSYPPGKIMWVNNRAFPEINRVKRGDVVTFISWQEEGGGKSGCKE